ncbi:hypothetical protein Q428_01675 [Fervidicella metallireducens AeB]|uniref:DUF11 domain-containing protein n=1 Tax=Fervidicella metallireducens AeB TaxID=1403537 RepID=A0A017RYF5_9CLOT|nr:DUF11 domain-containing protein [Fervidicella metallireducens]EYE89586.1 hypothetical protein Q428_01675 [Fervidicella metallireducens AeB]
MALSPSQFVVNMLPQPLKIVVGKTSTLNLTFSNTSLIDRGYNLYFELTIPDGFSFQSSSVSPTEVISNLDGTITVKWVNVKDLAPNELNYKVSVEIKSDESYRSTSLPVPFDIPVPNLNLTAKVDTLPRGNDDPGNVEIIKSITNNIIPLRYNLIKKGPGKMPKGAGLIPTPNPLWPFTYTLILDNNTRESSNITLIDNLPNGIRYLNNITATGPNASSFLAPTVTTPTPSPNCKNYTIINWGNKILSANSTNIINFDTAIWDKYTTGCTENSGQKIPHDTQLINTAILDGLSGPVTATLTTIAKDITIDKSILGSSITDVGLITNYKLDYKVNQYDNVNNIIIVDIIPDGMEYVSGSATPSPSTITVNPNGTTTLTWTLGTLSTGTTGTVTFQALTKATYINGNPVASNDSLTNQSNVNGINSNTLWQTPDSSSVTSSIKKPFIDKQIIGYYYKDGTAKPYSVASPGDLVEFFIEYNASDLNATQLNIEIDDYAPYNMGPLPPSPVIYGGNVSGPFSPYTVSPNGFRWSLGNLSGGSIWTATFKIPVLNIPLNAIKNNLAKLAGRNSLNLSYSDRDQVIVNFGTPNIEFDKSVTGPDVNAIKAGEIYTYTITIKNTQTIDNLTTDAFMMTLTDVIPTGLLYNGNFSVTGTGIYDTPTFVGQNVSMLIRKLAPGDSLTFSYDVLVTNSVVSGQLYINKAILTRPYSQMDMSYQYPGDPFEDSTVLKTERLKIIKTINPVFVKVGDIATYILEVTVPKGTIAYNVKVTDTFKIPEQVYAGNATLNGIPIVPTVTPPNVVFPTIPIVDATVSEVKLLYSFDIRVVSAAHVSPFSENQPDTAKVEWQIDTLGTPAIPETTTKNLIVKTPNIIATKEQRNYTLNGTFRTVDLSFNVGNIIEYRITVTNNGLETAYNTVVTDVLNPLLNFVPLSFNATLGTPVYSAGTITWTIPELPLGQSATLTFRVETLPGFAANSSTSNKATFVYNTNNNGYGVEYSGNSNTVNLIAPNLTLVKTASLLQAEIGDDIEYTLTVTIPYGVYVYSLRPRDTLPTGQNYIGPATRQQDDGPINTVTPTVVGQVVPFPTEPDLYSYPNPITIKYRFIARVISGNLTPPYTQTQQNQSRIDWALVSGGPLIRNRTSNLNITVRTPNIVVIKEQKNFTQGGSYTQDAIFSNPDDTIYYRITINSKGASPAYNINLSDILDPNLQFVSIIGASAGTASYSSGPPETVSWNIPVLNNGSSATLEFSVKIKSPIAASNSITNKGTSTYDSNDVNPVTYNADSNTTRIYIPALIVTKGALPTPAKIGDEITYTITIPIPENIIAYNLLLTDVFPSKQEYVLGSFTRNTLPATPTVVGNTLTYQESAPILGPTTLVYTFKTIVKEGKTISPYTEMQRNNVSIKWNLTEGGQPAPVVSTFVDVEVRSPYIKIEKWQKNVTKGGDFTKNPLLDIEAGDEIHYKLTISNHGLADAFNIITTDILSSYLTYNAVVPPPPAGTVTHIAGTVTWTESTLTVGETKTLILSCTVNSIPTPGEAVENFAESLYDTNTVNPLTLGPVKSNIVTFNYAYPEVTKAVNKLSALVGEEIEYTINVTVPLGIKIYDVTLNDILPTEQSYVPLTLTKNGINLGAATLTFPVESEIDASAAEVNIEYKFRAKVNSITAPPQQGQINTVTLDWKYTETGPSGPQQTATSTIYVSTADLILTKSQKNVTTSPLSPFTTDDIYVNVGNLIYYELKVYNPNSYTLVNVVATETINSLLSYIGLASIDIGTLTVDSNNLQWTIPSIPANTEYKAVIALTVDSGGLTGQRISNKFDATFSIQGATPIVSYGPKNSNTVYAVLGELSVLKYASSDSFKVGEIITYFIEITVPYGTVAKNIIIKDTLPSKQTYLGPAKYDSVNLVPSFSNGYIIFTIPLIDATLEQKKITITFPARVIDGNNSEPYLETQRNIVKVRSEIDEEGTLSPEKEGYVDVEVTRPYVFITKTQRNITQGLGYTTDTIPVLADDILEFRLTVHNFGSSTAYNIIVEDIISPYLEYTGYYDAAIGTVNYLPLIRKIEWKIDELPINTVKSMVFRVKVVGGIPAGGSSFNKASFIYSTNSITPITYPKEDTNEVVQKFPDIEVSKTADIYYTVVGTIIRYTVTFKLPKGTSIVNGQFTDILPIGQTYVGNATLMGQPIEPVLVEAQKVVFPVVPYAYAEEDEYYNYEFDVLITSANPNPTTLIDSQTNAAYGDWYLKPEEIGPGIQTLRNIYVNNSNITLTKEQRNKSKEGQFTTDDIIGALGQSVEYKLVITNSGPNPIYSVEALDVLSSDLKFIEVIYADGTITHSGEPSNGTVNISLDSINVGESKTFIFKVQILRRSQGKIENKANLTFKLSPESEIIFEGVESNTVVINNKASGSRGVSLEKILKLTN